MRTEISWSGI